ncbi:exonuclease [uncultured Mameliella sp.]|uniref:exonuclease n=1 Tax=uncultured Mameliella sp. TaxID=1447087 RepID=UPI0026173873|nr:exonuclease [uncultured Mameliella sp.]
MSFALIFDCEFLTAEGSPSRFWCGPYDPDPVVAQIGVAKLGLSEDFPLLDTLRLYVTPRDRHGAPWQLDPFFSRLTGITQEQVDTEGLPLAEALARTRDFAEGKRLWSWGKDEFNMVAISCYVEGIPAPLPASRFGNACDLLLKAGMPYEDLRQTRSDRLADYYKLDPPPLRGHDALDDALSVTYVLQHHLRANRLSARDFA